MEHPPEIEGSSIYRVSFVRVSCQSEPVESSSIEPNCRRRKAVGPMMLPTHIVPSSLANLCLICSPCFELQISIKYQGATTSISKVHINNMHVYQIYLCSLCHPSYTPYIWGSSASSDHSLCSRSNQFQAWVQTWASSREEQLASYTS